MNIANVLVRPIITEKTSAQIHPDDVVFEVAPDADKAAIKRAVESFYGVEVAGVRTLVVRGKTKRHGRHLGKRANWKKAYVRLAPGTSINIYEA